MDIAIGDRVTWSWGQGTGAGQVLQRFTEDVTREIKGTEVRRRATEEEPAFLIEQEDGDRVLKSASELDRG
ncbi:hypervirulence associated TUDOR domain-containing protein [Mangrovicoccus ximenensis]|uniref:DUF2945 domain-containing protein n=1 Tax=Mangrovicoccus ximenensis TaxID=1911570 RepID=UPI000D350030|nr:DUF2945 domain-containing protein [Mangrovicoccus ximenensis]